MNKKNATRGILIGVTVTLTIVLLLNTWQVFRLTSRLTLSSGQYHLENIRGELENTVNEAEKLAMEVGIAANPYLGDLGLLSTFIRQNKSEILKQENGCFNVYLAGSDWAIIPDFAMPASYVASKRDWYKGAIRENGKPYVTAPYIDAMTGDICYTVSVMLGDGDTVVGLDYTMDNIQAQIRKLYEGGSELALIVTGDGIIAGCSDESLIGKKLSEVLPEYSSVFSLAKSRQSFVTTQIKSNVLYENLFATASDFGWYLIVSESDWSLYKDSYIQLILTAAIVLLLLFVIVIFIRVSSRREMEAREQLLQKERQMESVSEQMALPLYDLLDSGEEKERENPAGKDGYSQEIVRARAAARQILEALSEARTEPEEEKKESSQKAKDAGTLRVNSRFRQKILLLIVLVILVSFVSNLWVSARWGNEKLRSDVRDYDHLLTEWIGQQKSILDMFCSVISTNPEMLKDYEGTISWLDQITAQYPEISVTYMTNPEMEPTVFMNNGWLPPDGWLVEERQWYIDTMESENGFSISAPYFDEQTGLYCVTFAKRVLDAKSGEYLGTFGIDFFLDKLIAILGGSYSDTEYAFLVDPNGVILNHPYGSYQMTEENAVNISELNYGRVKADGRQSMIMRDYDGALRVFIACRNEESKFVIYKVESFFSVYATLVLSEILILALMLICAVMIYRLLGGLMRWQEAVNLRMQEAADSAIAAGKAKSRFLAQMSHEIRTPINAVLGMNEMILRESEDEKILDYASDIQVAGRTLLSLINSILDFSKIEEGKMEIIPVEYDTASFINNLVASVSERARAKNLALIVQVDENLPSRLFGDDVRLSQVIMNILTNAVKYTEKGEVVFTVEGGARRDQEIELCVSVKDTGIGIRREDLPKLFESFERLDEVRNHNIEGTGLGMTIVTRLLTMMDSRLQVESEFGQGSTFSFKVRQQIRNDKPIGNYTQRLEASRRRSGEETLMAPTARILVVDDNEMNLKVAKNLLKLFEIVPDLASSGEEAIECVRRRDYHMIFLDHMMPGMDGIETLKVLREEGLLRPDSVVIALTANAVNGAREQYLEAGFTSYLPKPIIVGRLEEQLIHYLPAGLCSYKKPGEKAPGEENVKESASLQADGEKEEILSLGSLGYDTGSGLSYAAGDQSFYLELVRNFMESAGENARAIRSFYEEQNLHEYQIRVHALKSSARQIGANSLADLALAQETAAKENDLETIQGGEGNLLALLEKTEEELRSVLGEALPEQTAMDAQKEQTLSKAEALSAVQMAADAVENFEQERAGEILEGLKGCRIGNLSLGEAAAEIQRDLEEFDTFAAGEKIGRLLEELSDLEEVEK